MNNDDTTKVISATELKTNLGKYLDYVNDDNEVVVSKNGNKTIRITPYISDIEKYMTVKENARDYQHGGKIVSYEEFMKIYENSEMRMEYINGEIILLSSPSIFHQTILCNMIILFRKYFREKPCKVFPAPFDVHLKKDGFKYPDVLQPDVLIVCDLDTTVNEKDRYMGIPSLVVEIISNSSRSRDMIDKLNTYMLSGVKEFWLIDPSSLTVLVYAFKGFQIDNFISYKKDDLIDSIFFENLQVNASDIFEQ